MKACRAGASSWGNGEAVGAGRLALRVLGARGERGASAQQPARG